MGKKKLPSVIRFPDRQIASITEPFENKDGLFDVRLISKGMTKEEIEEYFPPTRMAVAQARKKGLPEPTFNMRELLRCLILEEFEKIGLNRERGNVRHFFYTNIIYTLTRTMGVTNTGSLNTTINNAWKDLVESGLVTYEGMNVESGKDKWLQSFARHSPFSNFIICVEKESLLESLKWLPELFRTTIITAGGQPSRATLRAFIRSLAHWKIDLSKPFYLLVITDLDPAGWYIQEAFASQIEKSIKYYNKEIGEVKETIRLFLRLDQVTDQLLEEFAIPVKDKEAKTSQAIKSSQTKIKRFKEKLGDKWERLFINKEMMKVELDAIQTNQMEKKIASELLELIEDHSLILIPEIMDETERQRETVIQDFFNEYKEEEIDTIIDEYLEPIESKKDEIKEIHKAKKQEAQSEYNKIESRTNNLRYLIRRELEILLEPNIQKYDEYADSIVSDELEEIKRNNEKIEELYEQINDIESETTEIEESIDEQIGFYREEIEELRENLSQSRQYLEKKKGLFLDPAKKVRDTEFEIIESELTIFEKKLNTFASQQEGKFGAYVRSVEKHFQDSLNTEKIPVYFSDVESDSDIQIQLAYLLTQPKLLLEENKSCLEHPKPAFQESHLLINALDSANIKATKRNPDLSKFRNAFSKQLKEALKDLMIKKLKTITVVLDSIIDLPEEYTTELDNIIEEITDEIAVKKLYLFLNYHPEDMKKE
jgi:hypothetical protein